MSHHCVDRRTLIRAGASFGCIAFSGLGIGSIGVSAAGGTLPLTGALVGWLVIQPDGAGQLNLVEIDTQSASARQVAAERLRPVSSLSIAGRQANAAAVKVVAEAWKVPPTECSCEWGRIEHLQSGRSIPFKVWTGFA